mgnify:CR=1 FL=1
MAASPLLPGGTAACACGGSWGDDADVEVEVPPLAAAALQTLATRARHALASYELASAGEGARRGLGIGMLRDRVAVSTMCCGDGRPGLNDTRGTAPSMPPALALHGLVEQVAAHTTMSGYAANAEEVAGAARGRWGLHASAHTLSAGAGWHETVPHLPQAAHEAARAATAALATSRTRGAAARAALSDALGPPPSDGMDVAAAVADAVAAGSRALAAFAAAYGSSESDAAAPALT